MVLNVIPKETNIFFYFKHKITVVQTVVIKVQEMKNAMQKTMQKTKMHKITMQEFDFGILLKIFNKKK